MLHKKGKVFQNCSDESFLDLGFRPALAKTLKEELGGTNQAAKSIMKWADVSERTAKNWIAGTHSPSGEHLIDLMRHSDAVLAVVLAIAGRQGTLNSIGVELLKEQLREMLTGLDSLSSS
jgi:hypothetical protein